MKKLLCLAVIICSSRLTLAQWDSTPSQPLNPATLLDQAAPFYVYDSQTAKPWHLTYNYRLLDDEGKPGSEGKVEFWWSAQTYRITWTKSGTVSSEWHTSDGKTLTEVTGAGISSMEHRLSSAVFFTYPKIQEYETGNWRLKLATLNTSGSTFFCAAVVSAQSEANFRGDSLDGVGTAYCFNGQAPVLLFTLMNHTIVNIYSEIQSFQNHNVARHIDIAYTGTKKLAADMAEYQEITADDAAFTPSPEAKELGVESRRISILPGPPVNAAPGTLYISSDIASRMLLEKVSPIYPPDAQAAHAAGTVLIKAQIGKDGKIEDAEVVSSPHPSLSTAALDAVRQWRYRPYVLNGQTVVAHTQISVIFTDPAPVSNSSGVPPGR